MAYEWNSEVSVSRLTRQVPKKSFNLLLNPLRFNAEGAVIRRGLVGQVRRPCPTDHRRKVKGRNLLLT